MRLLLAAALVCAASANVDDLGREHGVEERVRRAGRRLVSRLFLGVEDGRGPRVRRRDGVVRVRRDRRLAAASLTRTSGDAATAAAACSSTAGTVPGDTAPTALASSSASSGVGECAICFFVSRGVAFSTGQLSSVAFIRVLMRPDFCLAPVKTRTLAEWLCALCFWLCFFTSHLYF